MIADATARAAPLGLAVRPVVRNVCVLLRDRASISVECGSAAVDEALSHFEIAQRATRDLINRPRVARGAP